jgi:hypothetical protein
MQVHKENIEKVPNSIKGRDNITLEICGMDNIPEEDLIEHEKQKMLQTNPNRDETIDSDSQDSDTNVNSSQPPPPLPPLPPQPPPPPLPPTLPPGTIHGPLPHIPPASLMMQPPHMINPMLLSYPHPHQPPPPHLMMGMNPHQMMIHGFHPQHMIPIPPNAPISAQNNHPPPLMGQKMQQPTINQQQQQASNKLTPQPLMSSSIHPPLPPALPPPLPQQTHSDNVNSEMSKNGSLIVEEIRKVEVPSGCKIVHPEDDISLEEFRASHHKYKYIPPQYSAPAVPNIQAAFLNQKLISLPSGLVSQQHQQPPPPQSLLPLPTPLSLAHHSSPFAPPIGGSHQRQHQPVHYIHPNQQNYQNYHPVNGNRY